MRRFSRQAQVVVVASDWAKRDLIGHYELRAENVAVIGVPPVASTLPAPDQATSAATARRLGLPSRFLLYPAQTWPHKNHLLAGGPRAAAGWARAPDLPGVLRDPECALRSDPRGG